MCNQVVGWVFEVAGMFINYRGEDSRSYGALLYVELSRQFGDDEVFLDSESIPAGADFVDELLHQVRLAKIVIAVIGPRWLTALDDVGNRRLDHPGDWIRRELAEAFHAGATVIPVLTDGAEPPNESSLPPDIAALSRCQYRRLRHHDVRADLARLVGDLAAAVPHLAVASRTSRGIPQQLPAAPPMLVGREDEVAVLDAAAAERRGKVVVGTLSGAGGVGKTWLALYWAGRNVERFPGGQLFVNLRGFDPADEPVTPTAALHGFLIALGVAPTAVPVDLDAQTAHYRSLVATRPMLVVLDNAASSTQIAPLLPTGPGSVALITSRAPLLGLVTAHGARTVTIDVLANAQARAVLAGHLGADRLRAEPSATTELLDHAGGLPLALAIIAARAAADPRLPLAVLADELRDSSARLDALDTGEMGLSLRATLSWSHRALTAAAATLFALLGVAPGPDIGLYGAANLVGLPLARTSALLRELTDAKLVQHHHGGRYRMHDLVRLYASELGDALSPDAISSALRRVVGFYLNSAFAIDRVLAPRTEPIDIVRLSDSHLPQHVLDEPGAWAWLDQEHAVLVAAQRMAAKHGWHDVVWQLAWTLDTYHYRRGNLVDDLAVWQVAATSAERIDDPAVRNLVNRHVGQAYAMAARHEEAVEHLRHALSLAELTDDVCGQAHTHRAIWRVYAQRGDHERALKHASCALPLYRRLGNPVWQAEATNQVGWCHARLGQYDEAFTYCQEALLLCRRHSHHEGLARAFANLGYLAHRTGDEAKAEEDFEQALSLYRRLANRYEEADTLESLGSVSANRGQRARAADMWHSAVTLYETQGRVQDAARVHALLDGIT